MPHDEPAGDAINCMAMVSTRVFVAEITRALAVLALVFLSFAAPPALAASGNHFALEGGYDFCGTPPADHLHAPCHACRTDPATLPPAPSAAEPAFTVVPADVCAVDAVPAARVDLRSPANPRAPPAAV